MDILTIFKTIAVFAAIYLYVSAFGFVWLCARKDSWTDEFREGMESWFFRIELLLYFPIMFVRNRLKRLGADRGEDA